MTVPDLPVEAPKARAATIRPPVRVSQPHRGPQALPLPRPRSGPGPPGTQLHHLLGYYPSVHTAIALHRTATRRQQVESSTRRGTPRHKVTSAYHCSTHGWS